MSGPYQPPRQWNWFTKRRNYVLFMLRELTAVFIGGYLVFLLVWLCKLGGDEGAFAEFLTALTSPLWMVLHAIVLIAALWHTITWFNATPKAMPVFLGEKRAPDPLVAIGMGYLPWIVVSAVILWGVLR